MEITEKEFYQKLHAKYDKSQYDISKVVYKGLDNDVILSCPKHGEFKIKASTAIRADRGKCKKCGLEKSNYTHPHMSTKEFVEKATIKYQGKYDYSKVDMDKRNEDGKVCIICHELDENGNEHGEFWQKPSQHLFGKSCPKCGCLKKTTKQVIKELQHIYGDMYDYSKTEYVGANYPIEVICNHCGNHFFPSAHNHLRGKGCPVCKSSKLELHIKHLLDENNIKYIYQANKRHLPWIGNQTLDFYIPSKHIAIECQGLQHFQSVKIFGGDKKFKIYLERDARKRNLCKENNITLLYYSDLHIQYPYNVFEDDNLLLEIINSHK